ncbi:MAG: type II toxin-antitoxin system VapC family toxin [Desulfomonile tiedjei]|nr:type II toxin-antitoxin system VapC family toxin [Desulfomonile tiedjei]
MIVADANLISYLLIPGSRTQEAKAVLRKDAAWQAPLLWRTEFASVLLKYVRRGDFGFDDAVQFIARSEELMLGAEHHVRMQDVLREASNSGRSVYDCEYVVLAKDLGLVLVTADDKLAGSFPGTAVLPEKFLE